MSRYALLSALILIIAACVPVSGDFPDRLQIGKETGQVIVVRTSDWNASRGTLTAFSRTGGQWKAEMRFPVSIGKNGLGRGPGFDGSGPEKHEGDGRSPAGIWYIVQGFGTAVTPPTGMTMPYKHVTNRDYYVDDADSPHYNQWLCIPDSLPNTPGTYANSYERMLREDGIYELGLVVEYNRDPVIPGRGSAIFLHRWRSRNTPTIGCTAMSEHNLLRLMKWLRLDCNAVIIQVPEGVVLKEQRIDKVQKQMEQR